VVRRDELRKRAAMAGLLPNRVLAAAQHLHAVRVDQVLEGVGLVNPWQVVNHYGDVGLHGDAGEKVR